MLTTKEREIKMKNILLVILFILALGLMGRMEMQDEIRSAEWDKQNKQEVIKDLQLRCYTGDLTGEMCRGL